MKMKKTLCRVLCAVCALAMVLPVIFSVTASAASTKYIQSYYYPTKTLIGEELPYNQLSDQNGNPPRLRSAKISTPSSPIGPAGARTARRSSPTCPSCSRFWTNMKMCSGTWSTAPTVWTTPSPPLLLI